MKNNKVLKNIANPTHENEQVFCESCEESLVFGMKDNYHEFILGLTTVLECLLVVEKEGFVPELSSEWWLQILNTYPKLKHLRYRE